MTFSTLGNIKTKIRKLVGAGTLNELSDSDLNNYINSFYSYDFPAQFRSLKLKDTYTFVTTRGQDTYPFNSEGYSTVSMPCYCDGREIKLFQSAWSFFGVYYNWFNIERFATGSGELDTIYTGQTQAFPLVRSANNDPTFGDNPNYPASQVMNFLISANTSVSSGLDAPPVATTINITDDGRGDLFIVGDPLSTTIGTINYQTGVISFNINLSVPFDNVVIPAGNSITVHYNPQVLAIPLSIMFFQNQFTLRPVPGEGHIVTLTAYRLPSQALLNTPENMGNPEQNEWWETIAFGAAKKIYEERLDPDGVMLMDKGLHERYELNMTRTYAEIGTQRINTIFADQLTGNYGQTGGFFGGGGF